MCIYVCTLMCTVNLCHKIHANNLKLNTVFKTSNMIFLYLKIKIKIKYIILYNWTTHWTFYSKLWHVILWCHQRTHTMRNKFGRAWSIGVRDSLVLDCALCELWLRDAPRNPVCTNYLISETRCVRNAVVLSPICYLMYIITVIIRSMTCASGSFSL